MKLKILSLLFAVGSIFFCENAKAQTVPPACASIISDIAQGNTSQAATDALSCVTNIAGAVATPLCTAGCPNGGATPADCSSPCQPLCTSSYGAHNVACCLESLASNKVTLPSAVNTVLGGVCGAFAYTVPVVGSWCKVIPHATAQQALPYIGTICCNYYSSTTNSTGVTNTNACLGTTTPAFSCDQYDPSKICTSSSMDQGQKKEKDKE